MSQSDQLLARANALIEAGELAQAEAVLKRAVAADPKNPHVYSMMTHILASTGRFVQAEYFAKQGADLAPNDPGLLHNLGQVLYQIGKYDAAVTPLTRALELMPNSFATRAVLGLVLIGRWRYATASEVLKPGVDAGDLDMTNSYAHALHSMGRVEQAAPVLRAAVAKDPNHFGRVQHFAAMLNYAPDIDPAELLHAHKEFGRVM